MPRKSSSRFFEERPERPTQPCKACGGRVWFLRQGSDSYACAACNALHYRLSKLVDEVEVE